MFMSMRPKPPAPNFSKKASSFYGSQTNMRQSSQAIMVEDKANHTMKDALFNKEHKMGTTLGVSDRNMFTTASAASNLMSQILQTGEDVAINGPKKQSIKFSLNLGQDVSVHFITV
jgi:hypothetical protein